MPTFVTSVAVSVTKLLDEAPNTIVKSVVSSIRNGADISANLAMDTRTGINKKVNAYFNYGKNNEHIGLPSHLQASNAVDTTDKFDEVNAIISSVAFENSPVEVVSVMAGFVNRLLLVTEWFQNGNAGVGWGWDALEQKVMNAGELWSINKVEDDGGFIRAMLLWEPPYKVAYGRPPPLFITTSIPWGQDIEVFYHVTYTVDSDIYALRKHWSYKISTGVYPELDLGDQSPTPLRVLPLAPIRVNRVNVVDFIGSDASDKAAIASLLRTMNMDLDDVTDALVPAPPNESDLDDVNEAYIIFAIDIDSDEEIAHKYMYEHFRVLHHTSTIYDQKDWVDRAAGNPNSIPLKHRSFIDTPRQSIRMEYNYTTLQVKTGVASSNMGTIFPEALVNGGAVDPVEIDPDNVGNGAHFRQTQNGVVVIQDNLGPSEYNTHTIVYRKQLTTMLIDGTDTYTELVVYGLKVEYTITGVGIDSLRLNETYVRMLPDASEGGFIVPVIYDVALSFNGIEEVQIYHESLHIVVTAYQIQKLAWYQTDVFKFILTVVIIVVSVLTNLEAIGAILVEGLKAAIIEFIIFSITSFLIVQGLTFAVKLVGGDLALIFAAVLAITALFYGDGKQLFKLLDAKDLMFLATSTFKAVNKVTKDAFLTLIDDTEEFLKDIKEQQEALDAANDLLDNGTTLELYDLIEVPQFINFTESPTAFINRSIHTPNPGVLSLDMVSNYVEMALVLPKAKDT